MEGNEPTLNNNNTVLEGLPELLPEAGKHFYSAYNNYAHYVLCKVFAKLPKALQTSL